MTTAPEVVAIAEEDLALEIVPAVGARIHRLRVRGSDVLRTPGDVSRHLDDPYFWGSYVMAPWCNRVAAGVTHGVAGRDLDLPPSFPDGTAIHGQVSRIPWRQVGDRAFRVEAGGDGWPWRYEVEERFELTPGALTQTLALRNLDDTPMPAGLGVHPWFRRPLGVRIAGGSAWDANPSPVAEPTAVSGELERRTLAELPDGLDATWTDLADPPVSVEWPATGLRMTIATDPAVRYIVAASPAGVDAVAVEPQTHAPAGVRRLLNREPGALAMLEPSATLSLAITLRLAPET